MHIWYVTLMVVEVILAFALVALILIHPPKGEGMGGIGGAATLFSGKRTTETALDKITNGTALLFILVLTLLGFSLVGP